MVQSVNQLQGLFRIDETFAVSMYGHPPFWVADARERTGPEKEVVSLRKNLISSY